MGLILTMIGQGAGPAIAYESLTTTGLTSTATAYTNNRASTVTELFSSGLKSTLSIPAGNAFTGAVVTAYQNTTYGQGTFTTTAATTWPMIYYPMVPTPAITTQAGGTAFIQALERGFGLTTTGWSAMTNVGTIRLTFSRPLINPIVTLGGPGQWYYCTGGTCTTTSMQGVISFNPQYTFTGTDLHGGTVTPTLAVASNAAASAQYYAATGNVYGPTVNNLVQTLTATNDPVTAMLSRYGVSYTAASRDPAYNAASLVATVQVNTGGVPVTSIDIQTSYQMVDFGTTATTLASANANMGNIYQVHDPFFTLLHQQNAVEVSGVNTPASYGYAANSMSENSPSDFGVSMMSKGLAIGSTVMPYQKTTDQTTIVAPTAGDNSNAGYDGVTARQLAVLSNTALPANIGKTITLTVPLSNVAQPATLTGYLDFQAAGVFTGTNDMATVQVPAGATSATLTWTVPANVSVTKKNSWLRLRLQYGATGSTTPTALSPTGWQDSGETEDWPLTVGGTPQTSYTVAKTADKTSVKAGDTVTYQVVVTNTGVIPVDATFTDDLSDVVDDATLVEPLETGLSYDPATKKLSWAGTVAPDAPNNSVTVTYQVTAKNPLAPGAVLKNVVTPDPDKGGSCDPAGTCTTTTDSQSFTVSKSVDPASGVALQGSTVTYTVRVTNTGKGTVAASFTDNLSGVLDDGTLVTPTDPSIHYDPATKTLSWSGDVAEGKSADVSYQVIVAYPSEQATPGDGVLRNVVAAGDGGSCNPAVQTCETVTNTSGFTVTKTADKTTAKPGDKVTYTVHVVNTGKAPVDASFSDDLSGVVDDATLDSPLPTGATPGNGGQSLDWAGTLAVGESRDVIYSVTVGNPPAGDKVLKNAVVAGDGGTCDPVGSCDTTTDTKGFTVAKSVDKTSAKAGDTVTYTVHVVNTGSVSVTASFTDDLSGVVDDATLVQPFPAGSGLSYNAATKTLSWSGDVAVGTPKDVTYQVKLNNPMLGDKTLKNVVTAGTDGDCATTGGCDTTTPTEGFTVSKTADKTKVGPGEVLTYTVHIVNTNTADVTASFSDDLSGVLAHATLVQPFPAGSGLRYDAASKTLSWSGPVAAGRSTDVSYQVRVESPLAAGVTLTNVVTAGTGGTCPSTGDCTTSTPTTTYTVSKTADVSTVKAGDTVTYTVTVKNTGTAPVDATFTDNLSDVLDDATLVQPLTSPLTFDGTSTLSWAGTVPVGQSATATYQVTVKDPLPIGAVLKNLVTPDPNKGGTCDPAATCQTTTNTKGFTVSKTAVSSNADPGVAGPRDTVTYKVHVVNTGSTPVTATFTDDLSKVLANATLVLPLQAGLTPSGTSLSWSGDLAVGGTADVTYQVKVNDALTTSDPLTNTVLPGPDGTCEDTNSCKTETGTHGFTVSKTVDAEELTPGATVTYTVHVVNTGSEPVTASFTDNLSGVVTNATLVQPFPTNSGLSYDAATTTLSWSRALVVGDVTDVSYQVTVKDPLPNGATLANVVTPGKDGTCDTSIGCQTATGSHSFKVSKTAASSNADPTVAAPGDTVTYTVHVVNTGSVPVTATFTDDLSGVLANATLVQPFPANSGLNYDAATKTLSGSRALAVGGQDDLSYQVTVKKPLSTNQPLKNVVTPGHNGSCDVAVGCDTTIGTTAYTVAKSVDKTSAKAGETVTYKVHVVNTGSASVDATFTDDLTGVVDDATLVQPFPAGSGLNYAAATKTLSWSGTLAAGASKDVTYQVTLHDPLDGDGKLTNAVAPGPEGGCATPTGCETTTDTTGYTVSKSVDKTQVAPGDVVTYTVTVENTGSIATAASFTDNLSGVLDDATLVEPLVQPSVGVLSYDPATKVLSWSGNLIYGQTLPVTYQVTVGNPPAGDKVLKNALVGPCNPAVQTCETKTDTKGFTVAKAVDKTSAKAGDVVTYTVTVVNTGSLPVHASFIDDLSAVVDDASLITPSDPNLSYDDAMQTLSWERDLVVGETVRVTYQVRLDDPLTGDKTLRNILAPGTDGECAPGKVCDTTTSTEGFTVAKSADKAVAKPGDVVTYTVHVVNTDTAPVVASFTDDLSGVVDNATLVEPLVQPSVGVVSYDAATKTLSWSGTLAAGAAIDVSYQVRVASPLAAGVTLANVVTPGEGGRCATADACETSTPTSTFTVAKTVDVSSAKAGDTVTYTVTVVNTGTGSVNASFTDNLSGVVDDATLVQPFPAGSGLSYAAATKTLSWSGTLAVGASKTVTYQVTVNTPVAPGARLTNVVTPDPSNGGSCAPTGTCQTNTPTQSYTVSKSVDPASGVVEQGSTVTYTVHVVNTGSVGVTATFTDDLSGVVDDATLVQPFPADSGLKYDAATKTLSWSGALAVGGHADPSYQVIVADPSSISGDGVLHNVVGPCNPAEQTCETKTDTKGFTTSKSVDKTVAQPGGVVTYTVHVVNTGTVSVDAWFTDDLSGVLDDATLNLPLPAGAHMVNGSQLAWSGTVDVGKSHDVIYSVKVGNPPAGDKVLKNTIIDGCNPAVEVCGTETDTKGFTVSKTVDVPSAQAGDILTYTVTVTNTGSLPVDATFSDDLSGVLDDATLLDPLGIGLHLSGTTLSWSGHLLVAESVPVTYQVQVDDPMTGDKTLANVVTPGTDGSCDPAKVCDTTTPTQGFTVAKTVDKAVAGPGEVLTYTVHVVNTDPADVTASFSDNLSGVLNHATLVEPLDSALHYNATTKTLSWSGDLAAGDVADLSYQVRVVSPLPAGVTLVNAVTPGDGGRCANTEACATSTPTTSYTVAKSVDKTTAKAGDTVTYTVRVVNTGTAPVTAAFTDNLADVVDDATLVTPLGTGLRYDAATKSLSWSGVVALGTPAVVTYQVKLADTLAPRAVLKNVVTPDPDKGGGCATPTGCATTTDTQGFTVSKSVDKTEAQPGETVTYTVSVTNTGSTGVDASFSDDLSGVLDDAALVGSLVAPLSLSGTTLSWSKHLIYGETALVTYQVQVDDPPAGDKVLKNAIVDCDPAVSTCSTSTDTKGFSVAKKADKTSVAAGETLTYTVTVTNTGSLPVTATFTDDLSNVVDDATLVQPFPAGSGLSYNAASKTLSWTKPLAVGDVVPVTYQVTVNDPITGDKTLVNAVVPGDKGSCPTDECGTTTPTRGFTVSKTVDKTVVKAGDLVTYTVHVVNVDTTSVTASFSDDLSDVVDDATLVQPFPAGSGLNYDPATKTLSWSGNLAAGTPKDVSYQVQAKDPLPANATLKNVVTPGDDGTCPSAAVCETSTPTTGFTVNKSVDKPTAKAGETVTYTVRVVNTGTASVAAFFKDNLSGVVNGATLVSPLETGLSYDAASKTLSWAGTLAVGASQDVHYQVKLPDSLTGQTLTNVITEGCDPTVDTCGTTTHTRDLAIVKTSDVTSSVTVGTVLTYTVTARNTGSAAYTTTDPAVVVDDMSAVLDDATYNDDATATAGTVRLVNGQMVWTGPLAAGVSASFTYSVTVTGAGDGTLRNAAFVPPNPDCEADGTCPKPPDCPSEKCSEVVEHVIDAVDDAKHTLVNTPVSGTVLPNDKGDGITVTAHTDPSHGTVTINPDGTFTYTPAIDYSGPDSFTYTITDDYGQTDTATVRITIDPLAVNDATTTTVNTPKSGNVLPNDKGTGLSVTAHTNPSHGTVTINPDGTYTYTPATDYSGPDEFTYTITDVDGQTSTAKVTITIDPLAVNDTTTTTVNTPKSGSVLPNDKGTGLSVTAHTNPSHGTLTINPDGTYTYTPTADYSGPDSFTYTITDVDGQTSTATVTIIIDPLAVNDTTTTTVNTPKSGNVLPNDKGTGLTVTAHTNPSHGTVTIDPDGSYTYTPSTGYSGPDEFTYTITDVDGQTSTAKVTITVTPLAADDTNATKVDTPVSGSVLPNDKGTDLTVTDNTQPSHGTVTVDPDGTYTYTPAAGYSGPDEFTYTITDAAGQTSTAKVTITVTPLAANDTNTTKVDTPVIGTVLPNDKGTGLSVTAHTDPSHGTVTVNANGTYTYTPAAGYSGPDEFTYTITDAAGQTSTATVAITVTPVATDDTATTPVDTPVNGSVLPNDKGTGLTVTDHTNPSHGTVTIKPDGTYTYTPAAGYSGPDEFTYTITDAAGQTTTAKVTISVTPVAVDDTARTAANQPVNGSVLPNDKGTGLTVTAHTDPSHGTVTIKPDGTYTYTPAPGYSGPDSFTYTITDASGQTSTAKVTITVSPLALDDTNTTKSDTPVNGDVSPNDQGSKLTVTSNTPPKHGTVTIKPDGTYVYTPDPGYVGEDSFTYTVTDEHGQATTATVTIMVGTLSVEKLGKLGAGADGMAPDPIVWTIRVINNSVNAIGHLTLTDSLAQNADARFAFRSCTGPAGQILAVGDLGGLVLKPGETIICLADSTATQAFFNIGQQANPDAAATGTMLLPDPEHAGQWIQGTVVTAHAHGVVTLPQSPALTVTKTAKLPGGASVARPGDTITYTIKIANTGNVTLTKVALNESMNLGSLTWGAWPDPANAGTLRPGESVVVSGTYVVTTADGAKGGVVNTATATALTPACVPSADVICPHSNGDPAKPVEGETTLRTPAKPADVAATGGEVAGPAGTVGSGLAGLSLLAGAVICGLVVVVTRRRQEVETMEVPRAL